MNIPTHLNEIDEPWLAQVLQKSHQSITNVTVRSDQVRQGYGSEIARVSFVSGADNDPQRLIAKLLPQHESAADFIRTVKAFVRECAFYNDIAPKTPVRTPVVYYNNWDNLSGNGIILMEDISAMRFFDFKETLPDSSQLNQIASSAAKFHARWWNQLEPLHDNEGLLSLTDPIWLDWAGKLNLSWQEWMKSPFASLAPKSARPLCRQLSKNASQIMTKLWPTNNLTLVHGDYHLQNICWDNTHPNSVIVYDWDGCHPGHGAHDIAYLLASMPPDYRRENEMETTLTYHRSLKEAGITDYSLNSLQQDIQFGILFATCLIPMFIDLDTSGSQRNENFRHMTLAILSAAEDYDVLPLLSD